MTVQLRCHRNRDDGGLCQSPVARDGLACAAHRGRPPHLAARNATANEASLTEQLTVKAGLSEQDARRGARQIVAQIADVAAEASRKAAVR
ncbi:hypothetical protein NM962_12585 [Mycobacterium sp. SVM_VP21]|nr:hypothetical protein NM962_12585 [Mycobacterium sp. SVM_VP21]